MHFGVPKESRVDAGKVRSYFTFATMLTSTDTADIKEWCFARRH